MSRHTAIRSFARDDSGATAIEFAFVAIPFLLLLLGICEYARLAWTQHVMQAVTTSAARCIGVGQTECTSSGKYSATATSKFVMSQVSSFVAPLNKDDIVINPDTTCQGLPGFSTVSITYTFNSMAPQLLDAFTDIRLTASSCYPRHAA